MFFTCDSEQEGKDKTPLGERLLESRIILISKGVDDKLVESVSAQIFLMQQADTTLPIKVLINSPGGSADSGFAIFDLLRFVTAPVITIVNGICASAAVMIYLGGDRGSRLSLPNSRFLLHQPSTAAQGTASDLKITAQEIIKLRERYNAIVGEECGKTIKQVTEDASRDFWMSPEEAKSDGLVNKVISSMNELQAFSSSS